MPLLNPSCIVAHSNLPVAGPALLIIFREPTSLTSATGFFCNRVGAKMSFATGVAGGAAEAPPVVTLPGAEAAAQSITLYAE